MKSLLGSLVFILILPTLALEVELQTDTGILKGTLEETEGDKSKIILIHPGSGPTDRDGNSAALSGKNNSLKYLAEELAKNNIPSLRIDKRGIGASAQAGLAEKSLQFDIYVADTISWVKWLKQQGYSKVIVLGHSEGSTIGMIAAQQDAVDAYISLAGPSLSADKVLLKQLRPQLKPHPEILKSTEKIITDLKAGTSSPIPDSLPGSLKALFRPSVQPYMISWFKYDPSVEITKIKKPILIVHGSTDIQIPTQAAKNLHTKAPKSKLVIIKGMNHVLKDLEGTLQEQLPSYSDPKLPVNKQLTQSISSFVDSLP